MAPAGCAAVQRGCALCEEALQPAWPVECTDSSAVGEQGRIRLHTSGVLQVSTFFALDVLQEAQASLTPLGLIDSARVGASMHAAMWRGDEEAALAAPPWVSQAEASCICSRGLPGLCHRQL